RRRHARAGLCRDAFSGRPRRASPRGAWRRLPRWARSLGDLLRLFRLVRVIFGDDADTFEASRLLSFVRDVAIARAAVHVAVAQADHVGKLGEGGEVVDTGRVDELCLHGAGDALLELDERDVRAGPDRAVEDEDVAERLPQATPMRAQ